MDWLIENWQTLVALVGAVVLAARLIVKLTPTPADDAWLAKIIDVLKHVGLHIGDGGGPSAAVLLAALTLLPLLGGCMTAGTAADLLAYDSISSAAAEAARGVNALDATVRADTAKREESMLKDLRASILLTDKSPAEADRIVGAMRTHIANYNEQYRRLSALVSATLDNLAYIEELCEKGKQFSLYRADIGEQWKAYLTATAKGRPTIPGEPIPPIPAAPPAPPAAGPAPPPAPVAAP